MPFVQWILAGMVERLGIGGGGTVADKGEGSNTGMWWVPHITFGGGHWIPRLRWARGGNPLPGGDLPPGTLLLCNIPAGFFQGAVVVVTKHGSTGAEGLIMNKELDLQMGLFDRFPLEMNCPLKQYSNFVYGLGGPLVDMGFDEHNGAWTVAHPYRQVSGAVRLADGVLVGGSAEAVRVCSERLPQPSVPRVLLGYSSWGSGQLDGELRAGDWTSCPPGRYDPALLFGEKHGNDLTSLIRRQCLSAPTDAGAA
eukprot:Hpha_TRINITY_DN22499_c0_g1::TRINITY_DN22499_c0_g1_i1::g.95038::m.95038/K07735/algH; putative transcriptional regulator